jgi:hypothetical protein
LSIDREQDICQSTIALAWRCKRRTNGRREEMHASKRGIARATPPKFEAE